MTDHETKMAELQHHYDSREQDDSGDNHYGDLARYATELYAAKTKAEESARDGWEASFLEREERIGAQSELATARTNEKRLGMLLEKADCLANVVRATRKSEGVPIELWGALTEYDAAKSATPSPSGETAERCARCGSGFNAAGGCSRPGCQGGRGEVQPPAPVAQRAAPLVEHNGELVCPGYGPDDCDGSCARLIPTEDDEPPAPVAQPSEPRVEGEPEVLKALRREYERRESWLNKFNVTRLEAGLILAWLDRKPEPSERERIEVRTCGECGAQMVSSSGIDALSPMVEPYRVRARDAERERDRLREELAEANAALDTAKSDSGRTARQLEEELLEADDAAAKAGFDEESQSAAYVIGFMHKELQALRAKPSVDVGGIRDELQEIRTYTMSGQIEHFATQIDACARRGLEALHDLKCRPHKTLMGEPEAVAQPEQHPDGNELTCDRCDWVELPPFEVGDRCPKCPVGRLKAHREMAGVTSKGEARPNSTQAEGTDDRRHPDIAASIAQMRDETARMLLAGVCPYCRTRLTSHYQTWVPSHCENCMMRLK